MTFSATALPLGILALAAVAQIAPARAAQVHETFVFSGAPTDEKIAEWSSLPGSRDYLFQLDFPTAWDLSPIARIRGADRIRIELKQYPGEDVFEAWRSLVSKGVELVGFNVGIPTDDEIERLNRIGVARYIFVLNYFPGEEEAVRLGRLKGSIQLTFAAGMYPKFVDRPGLLAIPRQAGMLHVNDYWPWYAHMDVLNMLPHAQSIRVRDMYPPVEELPYLKNIKNLREVIIDADFDAPDSATWERFGEISVRWSARGRVPSDASLRAFEKSAGPGRLRRLIIDSDVPITGEERARLESSPLAVEWIHAVY